MAYRSGDRHRSAGRADGAPGPGRVVQAAGRPGVRLKELAHLYPDSKLRRHLDHLDPGSLADQLFPPLRAGPGTGQRRGCMS